MERPSIRQLECVVAVAEARNFRRAAEACFITQPALSQQIQQLERMLGLRLFERDRRGVLLTEAGELLLPRARAALQAADALLETATLLGDPFAGSLRLGAIPTLAPYVLPDFVPLLRRRYPKLRLQIHEARTHELVQRTEAGELDLILLALGVDLGQLATRALYEDPFVVALPADHDLAQRKRLRSSDLHGQEVLLLEDGHCLREQALSICSRARAQAVTDYRAASLNTLVRMVSGGAGLTLLPSMAVASEVRARDKIVVRALVEQPTRTIGLAWRKTSARTLLYQALYDLFLHVAPAAALELESGAAG